MVSRYLDSPMLIGNKKFDLRLYVLVTNYRPLRVWKSERGFARFCHSDYSMENTEDLFLHLTNTSLQKYGANYNNIHGGKWPLRNVKFFMEMNFGRKKAKKIEDEIDYLILASLKSVQVKNEK